MKKPTGSGAVSTVAGLGIGALGVFAGFVDKFPLGAVMNKGLTYGAPGSTATATSPCSWSAWNAANRRPPTWPPT